MAFDLQTSLAKFLTDLMAGTLGVLNAITSIALAGKITTYNGLTTAGNGVSSIVAVGRSTAQTAAVASVVAFTPAADGTFEVSGNVNCTTATTYAFALQVTYTDEGNTARTVSLPITTPGGALAPGNTAQIVNTSAGPYLGLPIHIRAKGGTAITVLTTGTFTTVTYNVEGVIKQTA